MPPPNKAFSKPFAIRLLSLKGDDVFISVSHFQGFRLVYNRLFVAAKNQKRHSSRKAFFIINVKKQSKRSIKATTAYVSLGLSLFRKAVSISRIKASVVLVATDYLNFAFIVSVKGRVMRKEKHVWFVHLTWLFVKAVPSSLSNVKAETRILQRRVHCRI